MSNEVWVKWRDPSTGTWSIDTVDKLKDDAQIKDLRKAFVKQQNLTTISPGGVQVREVEHGEIFTVGTTLTDSSAVAPRPGRSDDNPLVLNLPQQRSRNKDDILGKRRKVLQKIHLPNTSWLPLAKIPELDLTNSDAPTFVSQDGWLRDLVNLTFSCAKGTDSPDGTYRVPLTSLARCSRGGKTRALLELEKQLSQKTSTLFVSFNDFSDCEDEIQRGDSSLEMLCRRIAFAARPQENRDASLMKDFEGFKKCIVSGEDVTAWLGDQVFCVKEGRYYVFSSHLSTTNPEEAAPSQSFRKMSNADLPLIENLSVAKTNLNITGLSPRLALYYGLIPALTSLTIQGLADDRQVDQRVTKACKGLELDFDLFQTVLGSFFSGKAMGSRLDVLMDGGATKNYWIPCYLMELLKKLGARIRGRFGQELRDVASDSEGWSTCKEGSGDGWESLFLLVLWLRFANVRTVDARCIPNVAIPVEEISTSLLYNCPFPWTKSIYDVKDVEEFQAALDEIQNLHPWIGNFPKVSIYYPKLANFAEYDVFVCVWQKNISGIVTRELYGYQLKEGKEIPGKPATLTHSYLVRGYPALSQTERRGWKLLAKPELQVFFGVSGERWLPEKW
eukprot:CAMPEP_0170916974 /NCGR_PEP_ID=MMETSP0735-20130129/7109_1 /TAXON_ID=186038 /ORGANISM="Fragilariopsis kerguelensis, Strain L26-C5" /LENGTH=615 /DNA_ID=CAMNT_0011315169 /DNA_START=86 /DNA_END=1929 /DNA_ORIENTATION=-